MPQIIHTSFKQLLFDLFLGTATRPITIYMGLRTNDPYAADTLGSVTEIAGGGYSRVPIASSSLSDGMDKVIDYYLTIPTQAFGAFTTIPSPNGATHWFLCDAASGATGKMYASGPLTPGANPGTLSAAVAVNASSFTTTTAVAAALSIGDFIQLGAEDVISGSTVIDTNETVKIISLGTPSGGVVVVGTTPTLYAHPTSEAFARVGATRVYQVSDVQKVSAALILKQYH